MNMSIPHSPLVIGTILFPDLTQLDLTGPYEVFARMPATTVHLLAETLQLDENKFDVNFGRNYQFK